MAVRDLGSKAEIDSNEFSILTSRVHPAYVRRKNTSRKL